jgi:hypothetical protein
MCAFVTRLAHCFREPPSAPSPAGCCCAESALPRAATAAQIADALWQENGHGACICAAHLVPAAVRRAVRAARQRLATAVVLR